MESQHITLVGRVPSKKNQKRIFYRCGRPIALPSEEYEEWHEEQMWALKQMLALKKCEPIMEGSVRILATFFPPDLRKADLSNKFESVADLLVDAGIIEDDNWFVCPSVTIELGEVDRKNPRVEVEIYKNTQNIKI